MNPAQCLAHGEHSANVSYLYYYYKMEKVAVLHASATGC